LVVDIVEEGPEDGTTIEKLLNDAFGPHRKRKISYRFRQRVRPLADLCLVAQDDGAIVGTIRHWPIYVVDGNGSRHPALLLGPLAVATSHRGQGLGAQLMAQAMSRIPVAGHDLIILVGDAAYYRRFGFQPASDFGIVMPGEKPARVLALKLSDTSITGTIQRVVVKSLPDGQQTAA